MEEHCPSQQTVDWSGMVWEKSQSIDKIFKGTKKHPQL
jgi:hypothetical protein